MNSFKKQINELLKKGYSLQGIGVNNWAIPKENALNILNRFEELHFTILGGDVYELTNDIIQPNYDNWYCNRLTNETDVEFAKRSVIRARKYISKYNVKDATEIFFAFVFE